MAINAGEDEDAADVKSGHACRREMEVGSSNVGVHDCTLLDEEGSHLGEDDRVYDGAEPNGEHFYDAFGFFDLSYSAESPWVYRADLILLCEGCCLVQTPEHVQGNTSIK